MSDPQIDDKDLKKLFLYAMEKLDRYPGGLDKIAANSRQANETKLYDLVSELEAAIKNPMPVSRIAIKAEARQAKTIAERFNDVRAYITGESNVAPKNEEPTTLEAIRNQIAKGEYGSAIYAIAQDAMILNANIYRDDLRVIENQARDLGKNFDTYELNIKIDTENLERVLSESKFISKSGYDFRSYAHLGVPRFSLSPDNISNIKKSMAEFPLTDQDREKFDAINFTLTQMGVDLKGPVIKSGTAQDEKSDYFREKANRKIKAQEKIKTILAGDVKFNDAMDEIITNSEADPHSVKDKIIEAAAEAYTRNFAPLRQAHDQQFER